MTSYHDREQERAHLLRQAKEHPDPNVRDLASDKLAEMDYEDIFAERESGLKPKKTARSEKTTENISTRAEQAAKSTIEQRQLVFLGKEGWWAPTKEGVWVKHVTAGVHKRAAQNWPDGKITSHGRRVLKEELVEQGTPEALAMGSIPASDVLSAVYDLDTGQRYTSAVFTSHLVTLYQDDKGRWAVFEMPRPERLFTTTAIPWEWQPERAQQLPKLWADWTEYAFPDPDVRQFHLAMMGRAILCHAAHHALVVFHSIRARTGKSTALDCWALAVGTRAAARVSPARLGGQFAGEVLSTKSLIIIDETDPPGKFDDKTNKGVRVIKATTGGRAEHVETKHVSGVEAIDRTPTFAVAGNYLPAWVSGAEDAEAWAERLHPIPMDQFVPPPRTPNMGERVMNPDDGGAIVAAAVFAYVYWLNGGAVLPDQCLVKRRQIVATSIKPVAQWASVGLIPDYYNSEKVDDIIASAKKWMVLHDFDYDKVGGDSAVKTAVRNIGGKWRRQKSGNLYDHVRLVGQEQQDKGPAA